ncbi:hypothetical protein Hanom_Chr17g01552611 [Helianthus anomalus]
MLGEPDRFRLHGKLFSTNPICHPSHLWPFHFNVVFCMSKLQVLSFMFTSNCRRCPLRLKLTGFVHNVSKSCTVCPLSLT